MQREPKFPVAHSRNIIIFTIYTVAFWSSRVPFPPEVQLPKSRSRASSIMPTVEQAENLARRAANAANETMRKGLVLSMKLNPALIQQLDAFSRSLGLHADQTTGSGQVERGARKEKSRDRGLG